MQLPYLVDWSPRQRRQKLLDVARVIEGYRLASPAMTSEIGFSPLVGYPKWKVWDAVYRQFPSVKIPRFVSGGLTEIPEGVNGADCCRIGDEVDVDLHTQQVTLLPTSTEELSIPPALLFTKDQRKR